MGAFVSVCFCNKKTAYEMLISDCSSDVCSSDLSKTAARRMGLLAGSLAITAGIFSALPTVAQTLDEALIQTYQSNPTLSAARAQLRATNERVPQALSGWRPLVEAQGSGGKAQDDDIRPDTDSEGRSPASAALIVTQPLYRGGRTRSEEHTSDLQSL